MENIETFYAAKLLRTILDRVPEGSLLICYGITDAIREGFLLQMPQYEYHQPLRAKFQNRIFGDECYELTDECRKYLKAELSEDNRNYYHADYFCHWCIAHGDDVLVLTYDNYLSRIHASLGVPNELINQCNDTGLFNVTIKDEITL